MFNNVLLKKVLYSLLLLGSALVALQYIFAELVLVIVMLIFIFLSHYFSTPLRNHTRRSCCNVSQSDDIERIVASSSVLAQQSIEGLTRNRKDLSNLIGIQEGATMMLTDAFLTSQSLLTQQQAYIEQLLNLARAEEVITIVGNVGNQSRDLTEKVDHISAQMSALMKRLQEIETSSAVVNEHTQQQLNIINPLMIDLTKEVDKIALQDIVYLHRANEALAASIVQFTHKAQSEQLLAQNLQGISAELFTALQGALGGLQFGDMSVQSLRFSIDELSLLVDTLQQLQRIEGDNIADQINLVVQQYQQQLKERPDNPVSSSSMESGEVTLF